MIFPSPARENQLKIDFQRSPQRARLFCAQSALMKTNLRIGFQFCGCAAPRSPFMAWPSKSATALWENAPPGHFLIPQGTADRVGKYELRTADACRPALLFVLALRCGSILYGTTAVQYRLSAVWALSAAVRPAFTVLICAPWLPYCSIIQNFLTEWEYLQD